jgi:DUF4097 and DUF4098 domain-containing protein YvlB
MTLAIARSARLPAVVLLAAACASAGCDIAIGEISASERAVNQWTRSYPAGPDAKLTIVNTNGTIDLETWSEATIDVAAERVAKARSRTDAEALLEKVEIVETTGDGVRLQVKVPRSHGFLGGGGVDVKWRIRAPRHVAVVLENVNGRIEAQGRSAALKAELVNGAIVVRESSGRVQASTVNGGIEVDLAGVSAEGVDLETTNGAVTVLVPRDVAATLDVRTTNGGIDVDGLEVVEEDRRRGRLSARINGGGPRIDVETTNGGVRIGRR